MGSIIISFTMAFLIAQTLRFHVITLNRKTLSIFLIFSKHIPSFSTTFIKPSSFFLHFLSYRSAKKHKSHVNPASQQRNFTGMVQEESIYLFWLIIIITIKSVTHVSKKKKSCVRKRQKIKKIN